MKAFKMILAVAVLVVLPFLAIAEEKAPTTGPSTSTSKPTSMPKTIRS